MADVSPGRRHSSATKAEVVGAMVASAEELGCARLRLCVGLLGYGCALVLQWSTEGNVVVLG